MDAFAAAGAQGAVSIVEGELAGSTGRAFDEVIDRAVALSARSKDIRILAACAEASWHQGGLAAFAPALEDLVAVQRDGRVPTMACIRVPTGPTATWANAWPRWAYC